MWFVVCVVYMMWCVVYGVYEVVCDGCIVYVGQEVPIAHQTTRKSRVHYVRRQVFKMAGAPDVVFSIRASSQATC